MNEPKIIAHIGGGIARKYLAWLGTASLKKWFRVRAFGSAVVMPAFTGEKCPPVYDHLLHYRTTN
jgi:hypothetical protein